MEKQMEIKAQIIYIAALIIAIVLTILLVEYNKLENSITIYKLNEFLERKFKERAIFK
jgi:Na+/proline symporter